MSAALIQGGCEARVRRTPSTLWLMLILSRWWFSWHLAYFLSFLNFIQCNVKSNHYTIMPYFCYTFSSSALANLSPWYLQTASVCKLSTHPRSLLLSQPSLQFTSLTFLCIPGRSLHKQFPSSRGPSSFWPGNGRLRRCSLTVICMALDAQGANCHRNIVPCSQVPALPVAGRQGGEGVDERGRNVVSFHKCQLYPCLPW